MNEFQIKMIQNARLLFVVDNCPKCRTFKSFIERYNTEVPVSKRIKVIDLTNYTDYGMLNPIEVQFRKFISEGGFINFPILIFDGTITQGASSRAEAEALIKVAFDKDFIIQRQNPFLFNKRCRYEKKGVFKGVGLVCSGGKDD